MVNSASQSEDLTLGEPTYQAMEQAAEWFALLRSGEASAADQLQWQQWINDSVDHQQAWQYVERIGQRFEPIQTSSARYSAVSAYRKAQSSQLRRRQLLLGLVALGGTGLLGLAGGRHTQLTGLGQTWVADHRTTLGEVRELALQDGSKIWMNALSAVNEDYQQHQRRLALLSGEILIQTASDVSRPFVVTTPQGQLRALGTRFTVRLENNHAFVAVYEGAVEIRTALHGVTQVILPGTQTSFTEELIFKPEVADPAREAWSRGILIAQNITLIDLVSELRRYRSGYLGVSPAVADLRVFGSYPLADTDQTLAMLESVLPIRVQHRFPWWVSIDANLSE
ncbi:FecR domain-containing protein [Nitrincola sp.]|uniref:FecR domain-containing protein n=1 Tax=Nitrincola sp. TaxID=1926584 RepID=UPI003A8DB0B9